ncbi:MAG: hypothetical protein LUH82_07790 [Clostridiales bacterium]|nr:hypothetical protein [Clostridiales bacterium]
MKKVLAKRALTFICALLAFFAFPAAVFAAGPDLSAKVTINITAKCVDSSNENVSGTAFALYKVAELTNESGSYTYALTADFSASGADLTDIESDSLAENLAAWAQENNLTAAEKSADSTGTVSFSSLSAGLYLAVQTETPAKYATAAPFLISAPESDGAGGYIYEVEANPKVQLLSSETATETTTAATETTTGEATTAGEITTALSVTSSSGTDSSSQTLLKTGQLNWPVPVFGVLGIFLFAAGFCMVFIERKTKAK